MKKLIIVYDDWCPNCTRFSRIIEKIDFFNKVSLLRLRSDNIQISGFDKDRALNIMASFENNEWKYGYDSIWRISFKIPVFWIFIPFLYLLKITGLGELAYNELAIKRKIIPLHCDEDCEMHFK